MHNHNDCCNHDDIRYCKMCQVPFCSDCGKEWSATTWTTTPFTYPSSYPTYYYAQPGSLPNSGDQLTSSVPVFTQSSSAPTHSHQG